MKKKYMYINIFFITKKYTYDLFYDRLIIMIFNCKIVLSRLLFIIMVMLMLVFDDHLSLFYFLFVLCIYITTNGRNILVGSIINITITTAITITITM